MTSRYAARYIRRAFEKVPHFEEACQILGLDPSSPAQHERIIRELSTIGEFGTHVLAKRFPGVIDEEDFRLVARTALEFYWMTLEVWDQVMGETEKRK